MPLPFPFDFKNPDYKQVFEWRAENYARIEKSPKLVEPLKAYYKEHPAQFITDWGCVLEPRNIERNLPATIPFLLFPRQEEWCAWFLENWRNQKNMVTDKSRDSGMSWLALAVCTALCLFHERMEIGVGSRVEEYIDIIGDTKALFPRVRYFMSMVPVWFRGGWIEKKHAPYKRIMFPETESVISGESGKNIGRGRRSSIYIVDEAAFLENPQSVDSALSQTTNCRLDISTPNGRTNPFAKKRFSGKLPVFTFHWRDDPRKDDAWYEEQKEKLIDPVIIAQEIDIDYAASVEGVLIPTAWAQSAIGAFKKLGIVRTGQVFISYDVADEGTDLNCCVVRHGNEIVFVKTWTGRGQDVYSSVLKVIEICDKYKCYEFTYDADGLGSPVRGDVNAINKLRIEDRKQPIIATAFHGSAAVKFPAVVGDTGISNKDRFKNYKAQCWDNLRFLFMQTHRAVVEKTVYREDEIISISEDIAELFDLISELSQPVKGFSNSGKMLVEKTPDGMPSPNRADSVMMNYSLTLRGTKYV